MTNRALIKPNGISPCRVKEILIYDALTGVFRWRRRNEVGAWWNGRYAGTIAGGWDSKGYRRIAIDDHAHRAHRLAWAWMTGEWPQQEIDHVDGNRANNAWINLRLVSTSQNRANSIKHKDNETGLKGVSRYLHYSLWRARIYVRGNDIALGYFKTPEEAHKAYCEAADKHFGQFARHK